MKIENARLISFDIMIMQIRVNIFYSVYEKEGNELNNNIYKLSISELKRIEYSSDNINITKNRKMDIEYLHEEGLLILKLEDGTIKIRFKKIEIEKVGKLS